MPLTVTRQKASDHAQGGVKSILARARDARIKAFVYHALMLTCAMAYRSCGYCFVSKKNVGKISWHFWHLKISSGHTRASQADGKRRAISRSRGAAAAGVTGGGRVQLAPNVSGDRTCTKVEHAHHVEPNSISVAPDVFLPVCATV
jgi:hypothetical protein